MATERSSPTAGCTTLASSPPTAVLVGSIATVRTLERQLALHPRPPVVLGCVLHGADELPRHVRDVPVLGGLESLEAICRYMQPGLAIVSLPATLSELITSIRTRLRKIGVADRFMATLDDQLAGIGPRTHFEVDLAQLIGREPQPLDESLIASVVRGKTVVVTGAGGSIGSELCRIAARFKPGRLIMVERSENALFEIDRQIARAWPELRRHTALQDVVDAVGTKELFASCQPDVVFHAAAHKHVPMSEDHPGAALDNNLFGTISAVDAAIASGAERFVMVSTDKAVNPTSIMGMTKRLAELYVQHMHHHAQELTSGSRRRTSCSMVRFGNVLGSSGSVLETWKRQLADGGPLTVTDPRMTRYFMTIPEAAALVVQAAALHDSGAERGEVFVLDMGDPIPIVDIATRFLRAHGLEPRFARGGDGTRATAASSHEVAVVFTGVRPGEKLFEELALTSESLRPTRHPGIAVWALPVPEPADVAALVQQLRPERRPRDAVALAALIRSFIPEARFSPAASLAKVA